MIKSYAGIGARNTPSYVIDVMNKTAHLLAIDGYCCNTGAAKGADQAFANGAAAVKGQVQLMLPWNNYEKDWIRGLSSPNYYLTIKVIDKVLNAAAFRSVDIFHPHPENLSDAVRKLHGRNYMIIYGVLFIICWTPGGEVVGGTGQALRIAADMGITVYNLGNDDTLNAFVLKIEERANELLAS